MMLSDANFFDLKEEQVKLFKQIYEKEQRPNASIMQQLVEVTGLNIRIVRAWFQNERKKERKRLMEERRRQEKERKKQQKKQKTEKTPKENSISSDSTESESTITSGDCSSSSSNTSEESSSDADDNKNIKKPITTAIELANKNVVQNVCSTSQQQQTNQKPQQHKKNKWGLNMFILCICVFLIIIIIYIFQNSNFSYSTQEQEFTKFCGSHNSSVLLSAAVNDWLLNEKQKSVIKPQKSSEADYEKKKGKDNDGVTLLNFSQMDLKLLPIVIKIQLSSIYLLKLVELKNSELQQTNNLFGINWRLSVLKFCNIQDLLILTVEASDKYEKAFNFEIKTNLNFILTKTCTTTKHSKTIINYTRSDCFPFTKQSPSCGIIITNLKERFFDENKDFCELSNILVSILVNLEINNIKPLELLPYFIS